MPAASNAGAIADDGEEQQPAADRRGFAYGGPIDPVRETVPLNTTCWVFRALPEPR
jgi:hypothetical protein